MKLVAVTTKGDLLVEMSPQEWSSLARESLPKDSQEDSIEFHLRQAWGEGRLSTRVGNVVAKAMLGQGILEGKTFSEFLVLLRGGRFRIRGLGKKGREELKSVFLDEGLDEREKEE